MANDVEQATPLLSKDREASLRARLEYGALRVVVWTLASVPRPIALWLGRAVGRLALLLAGRLREVGRTNLRIAFPSVGKQERDLILRAAFAALGTQLVEFCRMRGYTRDDVERLIRYEGFEHLERAAARGCGVLILTGHLGAWELSSFSHSLMGHPMGMVIRRLDNPLVDAFVNGVRCLHGNRVLHKDDFARGLLSEMRAGRTVGILMDTNMTPPQGIFVPFFGVQACTASGAARIAQRTGAAVLPGFLLWEQAEGRYVLRFGEEIEVARTEDAEEDTRRNTARFTAVLESYVRRYPEQWLWMHRRWKTRPPGEAGLY